MTDPAPEILRVKDVVQTLKISRTTIWRMTRNGQFPKPIRLSVNVVGWRRDARFECGGAKT